MEIRYWSPDEPNTLRYPAPEGKESFAVDAETFVCEAAVVVVDKKGNKSVVHDEEKMQDYLDDLEQEAAAKELAMQKIVDKKAIIEKIKDVKTMDEVKEILSALADVG